MCSWMARKFCEVGRVRGRCFMELAWPDHQHLAPSPPAAYGRIEVRKDWVRIILLPSYHLHIAKEVEHHGVVSLTQRAHHMHEALPMQWKCSKIVGRLALACFAAGMRVKRCVC